MTTRQIGLVQTTFAQIRPIADLAASIFYHRLFEIAPDTRPMFRSSDMQEQGRKLMQVIGMAVAGLERFGELAPAVEELGRKHAAYGVTDGQYDTVAEALLWTLERGLGDEFTSEVRDAWTAAYRAIATVMKRGGSGAVATAAA